MTRDRHRLARVAAVHDRSFKVRTALFRSDYWLPDRCVAAARPGEPVPLSILKVEVGAAIQHAPGRASRGSSQSLAPRADAWY